MNAVDTNVLIYFYDAHDIRRRTIATRLIESLQDGVLLWQVACEFVAVSRRLAATGFTPQVAWERVHELRGLFRFILPTEKTFDRAQATMAESPIHFWDAMFYAACLEAGVTHLYSEDVPGQEVSG